MNADACFRSFCTLLKEHVGDKDDIAAIIRKDDVDSLNTYLLANGMGPDQCTDGYDQGLFQLAGIPFFGLYHSVAKYDAVGILNFLLHQNENLENEDYARFFFLSLMFRSSTTPLLLPMITTACAVILTLPPHT